MRWALFYHSLVSDWNHGNAYFLRGVVSELLARGHEVQVFEPQDGWSRANLIHDHGLMAAELNRSAYPGLSSTLYDPHTLDLDWALDNIDVVLVHEWNDPSLVSRIGRHRARHSGYRLLFHDTHHRSATAPEEMKRYDLESYDGTLAFGEVIRDIYLRQDWSARAWTWHEATDERVFHPRCNQAQGGDLVWIGNWGDNERTEELHEYLLEPVAQLGLSARVHGVRYEQHALRALAAVGIHYDGWLPNFRVPETFARFGVTVHIPRRPYREQLCGIPTIRVFEALACGIPLVSAFWEDSERLFRPDTDYLVARNGREAKQLISMVLNEPDVAQSLATKGRQSILSRHTCGHRVDELLAILRELNAPAVRSRADSII